MNHKIFTICYMAVAAMLAGCEKAHDEPGGDNPRVWASPIANPEKPKTDEDYDGKKDAPEPVTDDQRRDMKGS
jgi:hypothetical protein